MKSLVPLTTLSLLLAFTFVSSGCNSSTASSKMSGEPKMGMDDKMGTAKMSSDKMEAEKMGTDKMGTEKMDGEKKPAGKME